MIDTTINVFMDAVANEYRESINHNKKSGVYLTI